MVPQPAIDPGSCPSDLSCIPTTAASPAARPGHPAFGRHRFSGWRTAATSSLPKISNNPGCRFRRQGGQLGPDRRMPSPVFFRTPCMQLHDKSNSWHNLVCLTYKRHRHSAVDIQHITGRLVQQSADKGKTSIGNILRQDDLVQQGPFGIVGGQVGYRYPIRLGPPFRPRALPYLAVSDNRIGLTTLTRILSAPSSAAFNRLR